jgi:hypothetical protein
MLSIPVFAKLRSRRSPDLSLPPRARSLPRTQNPVCIQTLALSPQPRAIHSSFLFNRFQTLFSPRRTTAFNNPFGIMRFRTPASPHRTTALNNPFGFKWFRTLSLHNGGIPVFARKFQREPVRGFALPRKTRICKSFVFCSLHTLPSSVSCNPFICHSYENNRGGYHSSQNGTP